MKSHAIADSQSSYPLLIEFMRDRRLARPVEQNPVARGCRYTRLARTLLSVVRFGSAESVRSVSSVRHAFSSYAFVNESASIPLASRPAAFDSVTVLAVGADTPFKFVMIVVLGVLIFFSS